MKATRYYSGKQEKKLAKTLKGKRVSNSGAPRFSKGDVELPDWLIEAKTKTSHSKSMTIQKEWLEKIKEESFAMGKKYSALVFQFGPDEEDHFVISEKLFKFLVVALASEDHGYMGM